MFHPFLFYLIELIRSDLSDLTILLEYTLFYIVVVLFVLYYYILMYKKLTVSLL